MEISTFLGDRDQFPDQTFFSDQIFFNNRDYDPSSAQDSFGQPPSTVPLASSDKLGAFVDDGYQTNQYFGVTETSPFNCFNFNPVSSPECSQTAALTTASASLLVDNAGDDQGISTVNPYSSGLLAREDTTDLPHVNLDDFLESQKTYQPASEMHNLRNKNDNLLLAETGNTPSTSPVPELNTPTDKDSIMVASDDPGRSLDETNHLETSSIKEAPAPVSNAMVKKSKNVQAGSGGGRGQKLGRPGKHRQSTDAPNQAGRINGPEKRRRTNPTVENLDRRTQIITASQEATAGSPASELPFLPEDLEKLRSADEESPLNGDFLDTFVQYFVACEPHVTAIPGSARAAGQPGENTLPCDDLSTFILPVNINGHLACLAVYVAQRKAVLSGPLIGQQPTEDHQEFRETASRFVSNCLPEPYNNWNERWTTQLNPGLQQSDSHDSEIHYLWVVMHTTVGKVPPPFDRQLVRSFIYAICTTINHLAGAAVAPHSGGTQSTPGGANRHGEAPQTLWNVFSSTKLIRGYTGKALSTAVEAIQSSIGAAAFAHENSRSEFLQAVAALYNNNRVSELEQLETVADHLVVLTDAVLTSSNVGLEDLNKLYNDEAALLRIRKDARSLEKAHMDVGDMVDQGLRYIAEQKQNSTKAYRLQEALRLVDGPGTAKGVKGLREQVKEAPLQAVCEGS